MSHTIPNQVSTAAIVPRPVPARLTIASVSDSATVRPVNRERAISYLESCGLTRVESEQLEQKIFAACERDGRLKIYIDTLIHQKILIEADFKKRNEREHKRERILEESPEICTSKKRKATDLDNDFLESLYSPAPKKQKCDTFWFTPEPKPHKMCCHYRWYHRNRGANGDCECDVALLNEDCIRLEQFFKEGIVRIYKLAYMKTEGKINATNFTIDDERVLVRKIFMYGEEIKMPAYWKKNQINLFYSFNLCDKDASEGEDTNIREHFYSTICADFLQRLPHVTIQYIRQIQNLPFRQKYNKEIKSLIAKNVDSTKGAEEKFLYYASARTPRLYITGDSFDDFNHCNNTIKLCGDPFEADKAAVKIMLQNKTIIKKQMVVVLAYVGCALEITEDYNLPRPPLKKLINGAEIRYDTVFKKTNENNRDFTTYFIQNKHQVYPAFLIEYNIVVPEAPEVSEVPKAPEVPGVPQVPEVPGVPGVPQVPKVSR